MHRLVLLPILVVAALALAGCDTMDSDWSDWSYTPSTYSDWSPPSGDNRTHAQKLSDQAWWDEYNR